MKTIRFFTGLLLTLGSCCQPGLFAQGWFQLPDYPATERDDGVCFVIGSKAWCGTGLQVGWIPGGDFYCLDLATETWSSSASLPVGMERQYACGFSDGLSGYVVGGVDASGTLLNDVWMYDPAGNNWTQKASKPGTLLAASSAFVIGDTAYVVGGNNNLGVIASKEVWAYSFSGNSWTRKADTPFLGRWRASACTMGNNGYLGFGRDENGGFCNDGYTYEPTTDSWQPVFSFPGPGRNYAAMVSDGTDLLVFGGIDTAGSCYDGIDRFVFPAGSWTGASSIPTHIGRKGGMSFFANGNFFYTCGIDSASTRLKETWKYGQPIGLAEAKEKAALSIYPNPVAELLYLQAPAGSTYKIYDATMRLVLSGQDAENGIVVSQLAKGLYFLELQQDKDVYTGKWVKE
jgi:N-acetylneuraminic acid mutarotase